MRATLSYSKMRATVGKVRVSIGSWKPQPGTGWNLGWTLARVNAVALWTQVALAVVSAVLFYLPPYFLQRIIAYLESDPERRDRSWGWFYSAALLFGSLFTYVGTYLPSLHRPSTINDSRSRCTVLVYLGERHPSPNQDPTQYSSVREDSRSKGRSVFERHQQRQE